MTVRFTPQGCKVETTCVICPNGTYTESVVLSVDPASQLALAVEERSGTSYGRTEGPAVDRPENLPRARVRATRYGFELVERR